MSLNRTFDDVIGDDDYDDFYAETQRWSCGLMNVGQKCFSSYDELYHHHNNHYYDYYKVKIININH